MAGKTQQFTLQFNADASQAKRAVQDLTASLEKISVINLKTTVNDADLKAAADAAKDLQVHLNNALNTNTGQLDLSKFNKSIQSSNQSLASLSEKLLACGAEGTTAFVNIAQAIGTAQAPIRSVNKLLNNMMVTLKNTVKWELSSTAVHALEGALGSAVSYARNLNTSLTNIRIVTGQSADDMAKFAVQANKAAKELSTTTKAYADASLIYYQQGDSQEIAAKKAAITIKAANASFNTTAAEMSEYLTAVWNSYQVGANELERYVDIMASLGAKTATSLEEIATSMQKVAATANTVGVSMEQVSSIIATVSSVTRESAESIGTAYKTIFARIGDLKLGATDEDGIGLGQVSSALQSIGVEILDASGNLRDMGDIISDLGDKWQTMSEAQKTATAQVVAGKRQYTQLMALFENWDMYSKNLDIAGGAEGSLQKMQDVYAESWEAASDRVKASMETIYDTMLNDKVFISLMNILSDILDQVDNLLKGFGGFPGIITLAGSIITKVFNNQIANAIDNIGSKLTNMTEAGRMKSFIKHQEELSKVINSQVKDNNTLTDSQRKQIEYTQNVMSMNQRLARASQDMSETQVAAAQAAIDAYKKESDQIVATVASAEQASDKLKKTLSDIEAQQQQRAVAQTNTLFAGQMAMDSGAFDTAQISVESGYGASGAESYTATIANALQHLQDLAKTYSDVKLTQSELSDLTKNWGNNFANTEQTAKDLGNTLLSYVSRVYSGEEVQKFSKQITDAMNANDKQGLYNILIQMNEELAESTTKAMFFKEQFIKILEASGKFSTAELQQIRTTIEGWAEAQSKAERATNQSTTAQERFNAALAKQKTSFGQAVTALTSFASSVSSLYFSVSNLVNLFNDDAKSGLDKFIGALGLLPSLITAITGAQTLYNKVMGLKVAADAASTAGSLTAAGGMTALATATWAALAPFAPFIAIIGVLTAALFILKNAEKEEQEQKEALAESHAKANEALQETISARQKEADANQEVLKTFNELYAQKQSGIDVDEQLAEAAQKLAETYNFTGGAIAQLSGNYDDLIQKARQYATVAAEEGLSAAQEQVDQAKNLVKTTTFQETKTTYGVNKLSANMQSLIDLGYGGGQHKSVVYKGYNDLTGGYELESLYLGDQYSTKGYRAKKLELDLNGDGETESYSMQDLANLSAQQSGGLSLNKFLLSGTAYDDGWMANGQTGMHLFMSEGDSFEYRESLYKTLGETLSFYNEVGVGGEFVNALQKIYNQMSDEFDTYYAALALMESEGKNVLSAKLLGLEEIEQYSDFETVYNDLYDWAENHTEELGIDPTLTGEALRQVLDNIVSTVIADQTALDDYVIARQAIYEQFATDTADAEANASNEFYRQMAEQIAQQFGVTAITPEVLAEIARTDITQGLSVEQAVANFTQEGSRGNLLLTSANQQTASSKASSNYTTVQNASKLLKETMTGTESMTLFNSLDGTGVGWDAFATAEEKLAEYNRFLSLTYDEQKKYFENVSNEALLAINQNAQDNLTTAKTLYEQAQNALSDFVEGQGNGMDSIEHRYNKYNAIKTEFSKVSFATDGTLNYSGQNAEFDTWVNSAWSRAKTNGVSQEDFLANMNQYLITDLDDANNGLSTYINLLGDVQTTTSNLNNAEIEAQTAAWNVQNIAVTELKSNIADLAAMLENGPQTAEEWNKLSELLGLDISELMNYSSEELSQLMADKSQELLSHTFSDTEARAKYESNESLKQQYGSYEDWRQAINTDNGSSTIVSDAEYAALVSQNKDIQAKNATTQFENSTKQYNEAIEKAQQYSDILSSIDIKTIGTMGDAAFKRFAQACGYGIDRVDDFRAELNALSEEQQIEKIAERQSMHLQTTARGYETLANEAAATRDTFVAGSEEYLYWEKLRLDYANQATEAWIESEQVETDALQDKVSSWSTAFEQWKVAKEAALEDAQNNQNVIDILNNAVKTGELTKVNLETIGDATIDVSRWNDLITAEERAAFVAQKYGEVLTDIANKKNELNSLTLNITDLGSGLEQALTSATAFEKQLDSLNISATAKGAWVAAYEAAAKLGPVTAESLQKAATELPKTLIEELEGSEAQIKDTIINMYSDMAEENRATAEQAVADWEAAFNRIAALRKKILSGEDITGDIFGQGMDSLWQAFKDSGMTDYNEFSRQVWAGEYNPSLPQFSIEKWQKSAGLEAFAGLGANGANKFYYGDLENWYKTNKGYDADMAHEQVDTDVRALLENNLGVGKSDFNIDEVMAAFWAGDTTAKFMDENGNLVDAATLIDSAADKMMTMGEGMHKDITAYNTQEEKRAAFTGAQKEYNETVTEQQQNISDWQAISEAIASKDSGEAKSVYEALGDDAGDIMTRLGLSKDQLNTMTQEDVQQKINSAAVAIEQAQVTFNGALQDTGLIDAMGNVTEEGEFMEEDLTSAIETANINTADASNTAADFSPIEIDMEAYATSVGMAKDEFQAYAETLNSTLDPQYQFNTATEAGRREMYEFAREVAKSQEGFEDLQSVTEDTWKTLKDGSKKGTKDWIKEMNTMRGTMSKLFNTDMKHITADFVENHLDELEKMANGTEEEAQAAQEAIQDDLVDTILKAQDLGPIDVELDDGTTLNSLDQLSAHFQSFLDQWDQEEVGFTVDAETEPAIQSMQALLNAGTMTAEQINEALNAIGWEPEIEYITHTVTQDNVATGTATVKDITGKTHTVKIAQDAQVGSTIQIPIIGKAKKISMPGGGGRKTSSGSGGGGSKPETKDHKSGEDEIERYHEITEKLEEISQELSQIDKLKSRAFGENYLKAMDKEIASLEDEIDANRRLKKEAESWLAFDKGRMESLGATFDQSGNISNYEELMESWLDDYNAAVDAFNRNGNEEAFEEAEELFEKRKEWLEKYEESLDKVKDAEDAVLEAQNKLSAAELEKITYKVEVVTEINEADIKILEYYQSLYEDQLDRQDEALRNLTYQAMEYESNLAVVSEAMAKLKEQHDNKSINDADYAEGLKELRDQSLEYAEALEEIKDQIIETYSNALSLATEEIANHTEKIQAAADMMDSYISILGLLGKGPNYRKLEEFYDAQYQANLQNLGVQKAYLDELLAQEQYFKNKTSLTETEREEYEALQDTIRETRAELVSSTEAALNSLQAQYENTINAIFQELDSAIAGSAGSIANLADQYAYYQEEQERYVSTSRELYEISKLNRNIENSIEDAVSSASKAKLKALKDEINLISKKNDLSEYDIELMNLQYELALAQIALEEAQNAKDTVRLTRDANGNYAYQYTADQEKINAAQQQYEDVLQQINELSANRVAELEQQMLQAQQDYLQAAQAILLDTTLTDEQRTAKLEELSSRYKDTLLYIQREYGNASQHLMQNQVAVSQWYNTELVNSAQEAQTQMNETMAALIQNSDGLIQAWEDALNGEGGATSALQQFIAAATALTGASGLTYDNMTESIEEYITASNNAAQAATQTIQTIGDTLDGLNEATEEWDAHLSILEEVQSMYQGIAESAQHAIQQLSGFQVVNGVIVPKTPVPQNDNNEPSDDAPEYATGGLNTKTGWAWLDGTANHPELVLNAEQTQDILKAAEVTKELINGEALASIKDIMAADLRYMLASTALAYHASSVSMQTAGAIQQNIEIYADFPNVSDSNEIELAFEELVNKATQYVHSASSK